MFDLISIGSISIDLYFKGESLTFKDNRFQLAVGGKYVVENFYEGIGGGGANVAIGVKKNGLKTAVFGIIGNNIFKKIIIKKLTELDVDYKLCNYEDNYYNLSAILLKSDGERCIIHHGTSHQHLFQNKKAIHQLIKSRIVYLGNLPNVSLTERIDLLRHLKQNNITTVVNLGVKDCRRPKNQLEELLKKADIIILNGHEFSELVKAQYKDIFFKEDIVNHYISYLVPKIVIVTEGENGSFGYHNKKVYHQKAITPKKIMDATGAGDGYTAGFIAEFLKNRDIQKAMESGAKYAASILEKVGAN